VSARSERSEPRSANTDNTVSARSERSEPRSANTDNTVSARSERSEPRSANTDIALVDPERFAALWRSLLPIGRDPHGQGYLRSGWSPTELACRDWFTEEALDRDLTVSTDGNGNVWAWWGDPDAGHAVVTGSHLDSVPHGGAYDGPLGIVSALLAVDILRARGVAPVRPLGIVAFAEEEGSRFGLSCLGSRLLTGAVSAEYARSLVDPAGTSLATAVAAAGGDPDAVGPDPHRLAQIGTFIELHIEQGRDLVDLDVPVGVGTAIWPHGRWRLDLRGEPNHAGTTAPRDRRDPMPTLAHAVLASASFAARTGARATIGRLAVEPNATNAIPARVRAFLDARAADQSTLDELVAAVETAVRTQSTSDSVVAIVAAESLTPAISFDPPLCERIAGVLHGAPKLATAAGHDAGILAAAGVPSAMLFVRNPTGVSHAPAEFATDADCALGVAALADVLADLTCS
jgi:N-carbamoyl-L-amino-acid hydrolase